MKLDLENSLESKLEDLIANGKTDIECPEVKNSQLYQKIQNEKILTIIGAIDESYGIVRLLLIAKIAASSPILERIEFNSINLSSNGPAIAQALSQSSIIKEISFSNTNLDKYASETVKYLANSGALRKLSLLYNNLGEHAPKIAEEISKLRFLESITFSTLKEFAPKTAANLAKSKTLKKVSTYEFDGTYCLEIAEALKGAKSSLTVDITSIESVSPDQKAAIRAIAETNNEQVVKNIQNIESFIYINNCSDMQYPLPKEIVCQIAGNLDYNTLEFVLN